MFRRVTILSFFLLLVLGQIPGLFIQLNYNIPFRIHLVDIWACIVAIYVIFKIFNKKLLLPKKITPLLEFGIIGFVSTIFVSYAYVFNIKIENILFALRILAYIFVFVYFATQKNNKKDTEKLALASTLVLSMFGFIQYFTHPDTRWLAGLGWDDHYYRLIGTFFDPAFLGIIFVLGLIIAMKHRTKWGVITLTCALALTYSRASWLALFVTLTIFIIKQYRIRISLIAGLLLLISIFLLPTPGGEGVNLYRTNSIEQKYDNSKQAMSLIMKSPLIGWGSGNLCEAKMQLGFDTPTNSCRGLDNSFLFILASSGLLGAIFFVRFIYNLKMNSMPVWLMVSLVSVLVHSMFTNTLFYPFVMGWLAIILGVNIKFKESS